MARVMEKVRSARTTTEKLNCYATIERSMIAASTAALRLGDKEMALKFCDEKQEASSRYNALLTDTANYKL